MQGPNLQTTIIGHLRRQVSADKNFAVELAAALHIGVNAAYKRIEGKTGLTIEDLSKLGERFRLPWHEIFYPNEPAVMCTFSGFAAPGSCVEYLRILEADVLALRRAKSPHVWYVTVGLPDFYYFLFEELTLFQAFVWERMVWNSPDWQERRFCLDWNGKDNLLPLSKRIAYHYCCLPTTEVWNEYVLDNLLQQLLYAVEADLFERPADAFILLEKMHLLLDHLQAVTGQGKCFPPNGAPLPETSDKQFFYNEIMQTNILLLAETELGELVYSVLNNPNFIKTSDPKMLAYARTSIQKWLQRSQPLCAGGEKFRGLYFSKLAARLKYFEEKINFVLNPAGVLG